MLEKNGPALGDCLVVARGAALISVSYKHKAVVGVALIQVIGEMKHWLGLTQGSALSNS